MRVGEGQIRSSSWFGEGFFYGFGVETLKRVWAFSGFWVVLRKSGPVEVEEGGSKAGATGKAGAGRRRW